jgi:hypothetical protein
MRFVSGLLMVGGAGAEVACYKPPAEAGAQRSSSGWQLVSHTLVCTTGGWRGMSATLVCGRE